MKTPYEYEAMASQLDEVVSATLQDQRQVLTDEHDNGTAPSESDIIPSKDIDPHRNAPRPDPACLYGLVGEIARAGSANTEANPFAIAAAIMSYLGVALGRGPYMPIGDDWHHARLFGLHVGRSGLGRKGTATKLIKRIHKDLEKIDKRLAPQMHDGGLSSREGLAMMIHDGYTSGKDEVQAIEDKRLWVLEPEFANVMHQTSREGNTLSAALRDCWDGGSIKPATKTSRIWATNTHIGMTGNITPSELLKLLKSRELANGFANRYLIYWAEQVTINPYPQYTPDSVVQTLAERVAAVLRYARADRHAQSDWMCMELAHDAREYYAKLYKGELRDNSYGTTVNGLLERRAPMLLRMAMLFALTDLTQTIEIKHLEAALAWVRYWVDSVRYIFQTELEEVQTAQTAKVAQRIVDFLSDGKTATRTEITRDCFHGHVKKDVIDVALADLLSAMPQVIEVQELTSVAGRAGAKTKVYRRCDENCAKSANCVANQGLTENTEACEVSEQCEVLGAHFNGDEVDGGLVRTVRKVRDTQVNTQLVDLKESSQSSHTSHRFYGDEQESEVM